jgi:7-cyano-7-deazaguanine reductase
MHDSKDPQLDHSPLGKATVYYDHYKADLLFAIARANNRGNIGVSENQLPFVGADIWHGYEFSWLNQHAIPQAHKIKITIDCASPNLIESKSLKLYLYSFANTKFASQQAVIATIERDLRAAAEHPGVQVELRSLDLPSVVCAGFNGVCLDQQNVTCHAYQVNSNYLACDHTQQVSETVWSNLLKSNCLVTGHPDWASLRITYTGAQIEHVGLLQYIVSFREHQGFHEHCVERIFTDILRCCQPRRLHVEARYTRRGGLDINPVRAINAAELVDLRLFRQ